MVGGSNAYFNFDLVIGEDFKNQGGMILEDTEIAIDKADSLASVVMGYETTRETAQIKGDSALFRLLSAG